MADGYRPLYTPGGSAFASIRLAALTGDRGPPLEGRMLPGTGGRETQMPCGGPSPWETQWGQLNSRLVAVRVRAVRPFWLGPPRVAPLPCNTPPLSGGLPGAPSSDAGRGSG
jgi:hypothetical protein